MDFTFYKEKIFVMTIWGDFRLCLLRIKGVDGLTFEKAKNKLLKLVALEADRFDFLKNSDKLTDNEKQRYGKLIEYKIIQATARKN